MKNLFPSLLLCGAFLLCAFPTYALFELRVGEPRESWWTQPGTIEEASLTVHPRGLYLEYGLFLTFSAANTWFASDDSLEVVLDFELPAHAIVHDSWLWIGDNVAKANILDRWTASGIYEGIVERRQDPSILMKMSPTQYQLRVFPMRGDETRKVKITYLMPVSWQADQVKAALPVEILRTSTTIPTLHLAVFDDFNWPAPAIAAQPDLVFTPAIDTVQGAFFQVAIAPSYLFNQSLELRFDNPMGNTGYYARKLDDGDGSFYEVAFLPSHFLPPPAPRKVVVVIDAETQTFSYSLPQVLALARASLDAQLSDQDSFNVIYQKTSLLWPVARASADWLPATAATIDAVFDTLDLTFSADVAPLLGNAFDFIATQGNTGRILLLSSSTNYGSVAAANVLLANIQQAASPLPGFHIVDFRTAYAPGFLINGTYYTGSEYLLTNLAQLSGGTYENVRAGASFDGALDRALQGLVPIVSGYDFHTSLQNGFCYNRFYPGGQSFNTPVTRPILQIGKFNGDLPLKIEFSGEVDGQVIGIEVSIPDAEILSTDSLLSEMWHGNYIQLLEGEQPTGLNIAQVIDLSIDNRILSLYTAFLCLEDTIQYCEECIDDPITIATIDPAAGDSLVRAWPNPFVEACHFAGTLPPGHHADEVSIEIHAVDGRLVARFAAGVANDGQWSATWNGLQAPEAVCPPGVYFAIVRAGSTVSTVRLIRRAAD